MSQPARLDAGLRAAICSPHEKICDVREIAGMTGRYKLVAIMVVWTGAAIMGLTVALAAVGWLGLWVAVGAVAGLGTTIVGGWLGQLLFATDYDAMLAARAAEVTGRDKTS
jgi:hypothetical protein